MSTREVPTMPVEPTTRATLWKDPNADVGFQDRITLQFIVAILENECTENTNANCTNTLATVQRTTGR